MSTDPPSPPAQTDRNLLFGVLALQADLLDAAQFAEACTAWSACKDRALAELLIERGWLTAQDRGDIERLLQRKLRKHSGDAHASLAAALCTRPRDLLAGLADPDIQHSLAGMPGDESPAPLSTIAHTHESRGRYTLTRAHARGGIGQVWLARDDSLGREVALKEVRADCADQEDVLARFVAEARITGQLEHPGIVPVYELTRRGPDWGPFYTMRFVKGRTLREASRDYHRRRAAGRAGPLERRELLGQFLAVCNAVAYAHSRGVVHRDLKGPNVLVGDFGEVIVLDWGLAKVLGKAEGETTAVSLGPAEPNGETMQGQVVGTPGYMSPEQAAGRADLVSERSDVYGLGAILYEILTGDPPFGGEDTQEVLRRVLQESPAPARAVVAGTPRALEAVCLKALAKHPAARYGSAAELATEIRHYLADEPVSAYREPWVARARRWLGRHRTLVSAAAAALVVALASLGTATALLADANRDMRAARDQAVKQQAEAQRQRDLARTNFGMARDAVEEYGTKVSKDARLKEKDLHSLRKDLLRSAARFHQKFVAQHADDPSLRADLGRAYHLLASLTSEIDDASKAMPLEERALALFKQLAAASPRNPAYQDELAACFNNLGLYLMDSGKYDEAIAAWRKSIAGWKPLVEQHPTEGKYARGLGGTFCNLGFVQRQQKDLPAARDSFRAAIRLLDPVCARNPKDETALKFLAHSSDNLGYNYRVMEQPGAGLPFALKALKLRKQLKRLRPGLAEHDGHLARTLQVLALLYQDLGKIDEAEQALREAVAVSKRGAEPPPPPMEPQINRFTALRNLGYFYSTRGQPAAAIPPLRESAALQEQFLAGFPSNTPYRITLGKTYLNLSNELIQTKSMDEARQAFGDGIRALETVPKKARNRFPELRGLLVEAYPKYALFLGQLGRHADTVAVVEALLKLPDPPADFPYQAAGALALAAGAAGQDESLAPAERQKLAGQYAARALGLLRQADAAGFFKDAARVRQLRNASEFASLHSQKDFRQWLSTLPRRPQK